MLLASSREGGRGVSGAAALDGVLAMKHVLIMAVAGAGVAGLLTASVSEPAAWALVLAGIAGSGFLGRRRSKKSIEIED
jgi:hypothetical protein